MENWKIGIAAAVLFVAVNCFGAAQTGITYNGEPLHLSSEVRFVDNSVLLPLRDVTESLGYKVNWDPKIWGKITITKGSTTVILQIGSKEAKVNGESKALEVAPNMYMVGKNTVTYVPIRFISEAFGIGVKWDSVNKMVYLTGEEVTLQQTSSEKAAALEEEVIQEASYAIDKSAGKLLEDGKPIADVGPFDKEATVVVETMPTNNGNYIVTVTETTSGALTSCSYQTYYIKNSKVIEKMNVEPSWLNGNNVAYNGKDLVAFCDGKKINVYNDKTASLINTYNTSTMTRVEKNKEEETYFNLDKVGSNYAIGIINGKTYVADFTTNKMTCLLDSITNEEDNFYVYQYDLTLFVNDIQFVRQNGSQLIFEYPSITEGTTKEIVYTIGQ